MLDMDEVRRRRDELQAELKEVNDQLANWENRQKQEKTRRLSDIVDEIESLVSEARRISEESGIPFLLNLNGSTYGDQLRYETGGYWNSSGLGC